MQAVLSLLLFALMAIEGCLAADRLVFAHFMVGLTYSFDAAAWRTQEGLAASKGIDAFVLNVGSDDWQFKQVR